LKHIYYDIFLKEKRIFFPVKHPDQLWGKTSLLLSEYQGFLVGVIAADAFTFPFTSN
jgi:hypothetical protein